MFFCFLSHRHCKLIIAYFSMIIWHTKILEILLFFFSYYSPQDGCWGCFDEAQSLNKHSLSVFLDHVQSIFQALRARHSFMYLVDGTEVCSTLFSYLSFTLTQAFWDKSSCSHILTDSVSLSIAIEGHVKESKMIIWMNPMNTFHSMTLETGISKEHCLWFFHCFFFKF